MHAGTFHRGAMFARRVLLGSSTAAVGTALLAIHVGLAMFGPALAPRHFARFDILHTLMRSPGRVFTRGDLLRGDDALDRTVDAHIKNLRRKIEDDRANPQRIVTVFGVG